MSEHRRRFWLDWEVVVNTYDAMLTRSKNGKTSCAKVAAELIRQGHRSRNGKPPTRAAVHYIMSNHSKASRLLLSKNPNAAPNRPQGKPRRRKSGRPPSK